MDRLKVGVCVLDPKGRVVTANSEFHRQRDAHDAFSISTLGELGFSSPDVARVFRELRSHALAHGQHGARPRKEAITVRTGSVLCIEVVPLDRSEEIGSTQFGGCIVYSTDTSQSIDCNTDLIQSRYGLTVAERELLGAISEGLTNSQIAGRRNRAVTTINNQVKSILAKTDCSTRTQLVRTMMCFGVDYLN
ncbi:MAG: helix-turn-helix transcriptional regulator, partial [Ruegeria sp.]